MTSVRLTLELDQGQPGPLHVPWLDKLTELCQSAETLQTSRTAHWFIQVTCFLGLRGANAAFLLPSSIGCVCNHLPKVKQKVLNPLFASRVKEVEKSSGKCPGIRKGNTNLFYWGTPAEELSKGQLCFRTFWQPHGWEWNLGMI